MNNKPNNILEIDVSTFLAFHESIHLLKSNILFSSHSNQKISLIEIMLKLYY